MKRNEKMLKEGYLPFSGRRGRLNDGVGKVEGYSPYSGGWRETE